MSAFLKEEQETKLSSIGWNPIINGAYIILYKDEFTDEVWKEHCKTLNENPDKKELVILVVGTK
jgi:hypothetical protein